MSDDDRNERGRNVKDALSRRFESDTTAENDETDENASDDMSGKADMSSKNDTNAQQVTNVKEEWPSRMFYLPDETTDRLDSEYDRLVYECGSELGWTPKKSRHYYPVIAHDGLEAVVEMDPDEFQSRVEGLSLLERSER